jgi:hypothetical protein
MPDHPAIKALLEWKPDALIDAKLDFGELTLTVAPERIRAACATVQAAGYNFFEDMVSARAPLPVELPHPLARAQGTDSAARNAG